MLHYEDFGIEVKNENKEERKNRILESLYQSGYIQEKQPVISRILEMKLEDMPKPIGAAKPTMKQVQTIYNFIEKRGDELREETKEFLRIAHKYLVMNQYTFLISACMSIYSRPTDKQRELVREMLKCPLIHEDIKKEMTAEQGYKEVSEMIQKYISTFNSWKKVTPAMREDARERLRMISAYTDELFIDRMTEEDYESLKSATSGDFYRWIKSEEEALERERWAEDAKRRERESDNESSWISEDEDENAFLKEMSQYSSWNKKETHSIPLKSECISYKYSAHEISKRYK